MLPGLTTPAFLRRPLAGLCALLLSLVLGLGLSGCGGAGQPSQQVLLSALALQIGLTQRSIASALSLSAAAEPVVSRVRVETQQPAVIGGAKGLHLTGRFDWRLAGDPIRVDSGFDLYLQRGERGQSWRLAQPSGSADGTTQDWLTYPLPLKGDAA
jgi:hypothetical protein